MARPSKTGGKTSEAKARNAKPAKGRKTTKTKRRIAPTPIRVKRHSVSGPSKDLKDARAQQSATAEILKVIASSPTDVQPVFEAIAASANRLLGGFSTAVSRFIDGMVHLAAFTPVNPTADAALRSTFPAPTAVLPAFVLAARGEPAQIADTEALADERLLAISRARGYRSVLFVPLMNGGLPIGMISVARVAPGTFAPHHVQLLQTFADQAVIAIENVRLFNEVDAKTRDLTEALQQQTATADVLKVISRSAFDLETVLTTLVESAARLCEADEGIILQPKGDGFGLVADWGLKPSKREFLQEIVFRPTDGRLTGRVLAESKVVHIHDVLSEPDFVVEGDPDPARTRLGLPLLRDGTPIGVFVLTRMQMAPFTDRQIELVETFADQAVIAISNAELFRQVQQRTRELSQSLDDLRAAQDRLVQTEKLASLGQLTAGIAHEIKNPLNFVNNFSALSVELVDELDETLVPAPLDQKMRGDIGELTGMLKLNLEKVVQHGKRADSIVKNMLQHSRESSGERRSADINALVGESLNLAYHGARAEKSGFEITLQRDFDANAGVVELFPQEISRALLNLLSNGFYAATRPKAENGGAGAEPTVRATTKNLGSSVEIRIRDNGAGIPPEIREKMFNPFFTTKPTGEGTGLGLSMTHDIIVKQHGGRIDVETRLGEFTEFIIILPRNNRTVPG